MHELILIVDDEPNVRLNYRRTLETEGFIILEADSGAAALELLARNRVDLAILDMRMPEMDGLELLAQMRKQGFATPAAIVTAHGDVPHAVRAMKLGAIDFLQKPLTPPQLRELVGEVLARHRTAEEGASAAASDPALSPTEKFDHLLIAAKRLLNLQDFEPAREALVAAMALNPQSAEAFNLAGVLFESLEDSGRAKKCYGQAIRLDKHYEPAQQNMRRLYELSHFGSSKEPFALGDD